MTMEPLNCLKIALSYPFHGQDRCPDVHDEKKKCLEVVYRIYSLVENSKLFTSESTGKSFTFELQRPAYGRIQVNIDHQFNSIIKPQISAPCISNLHLKDSIFNSASFHDLLISLPYLKSLTLENLSLNAVLDMEKKHQDYHTSFSEEFGSMDHQMLGGLEINYAINRAQDFSLGIAKALSLHKVELEELVLKSCNWVDWLTVEKLISQIPSLRRLSCLGCSLLHLNPNLSKLDEDNELTFYAQLPEKLNALIQKYPNSRLRSFIKPDGEEINSV
jgi:hypothetical protein